MFLRIKILKIDKKKKKLSFITSAKINALLFLVTVQIRLEKGTKNYLFYNLFYFFHYEHFLV